jgi:tripartite-type tricarboxylate transporter receptor subunit TctC
MQPQRQNPAQCCIASFVELPNPRPGALGRGPAASIATEGIRRKQRAMKFRFARLSLVMLLVGWGSAAIADPADFYRGRTVEILVGFSPGGGYDAYARALSRSIGNHIPGNPQVVVRNMTGAGSLRLARYLQDAAPRDGLSFGTIDNGLLTASVMKDSVQFDAPKLGWLGSISRDLETCMLWHASPAKTLADLRTTQAVFGVTGRDDIRFTATEVLRKVAGAKIKIVSGYPGTTDIRIAMEKGEIDGVCESWQSLKATKPDWIDDRKVNIIVQMGFERHPELPTVPMIGDLARSTTEREALALLFSGSEAGRPFGAPPEIPTERLTALRRAFDATMTDPDFVAVTSRARLGVDPISGERTEAFLHKVYQSSPTAIEAARKLVE